jgi:demethylmenaquinone methyltransferase/2-methoxy-6-polyprenyl-1,4-benzoquinol methylase
MRQQLRLASGIGIHWSVANNNEEINRKEELKGDRLFFKSEEDIVYTLHTFSHPSVLRYVKKMKTEDLGNSKILTLIFKPAGMLMGSRVRQWLMNPVKTLQAADVQPAQTILEVGCGTGFFTVPAAQMIGDQGSLVAMDASSGFLEEVARKVQKAKLNNVRIVQRDALNTDLETASIDKVLLFGVIPFPLLPLDRLLPEMHRVLKPEGTMAVWLFPRLVHSWVPKSILRSELFEYTGKGRGVYNYRRC